MILRVAPAESFLLILAVLNRDARTVGRRGNIRGFKV